MVIEIMIEKRYKDNGDVINFNPSGIDDYIENLHEYNAGKTAEEWIAENKELKNKLQEINLKKGNIIGQFVADYNEREILIPLEIQKKLAEISKPKTNEPT